MVREFFSGRSFDSRLFTAMAGPHRNADLSLKTRVYLRRVDPVGPTGVMSDNWNSNIPINHWVSAGEWESFRTTFKTQIETRFNGKMNLGRLWLVPSANWGFVCHRNQPCRPNVKCLLEIQLQPSEHNAHLVVNCYHVAPGVFIRASMAGQTGTLVNANADAQLNFCNRYQDTLPHEFGHHLGLGHVGAGAPGCVTGGEAACYCPTTHSAPDQMGAGDAITSWHARPWQTRIGRHMVHLVSQTPELRWDVSVDHRPMPLDLSEPSRTLAPGGVPDMHDAGPP